jgi:putative Holliday junction resolvase
MPRILCIDFGMKRTGLAVTDPLQIIATGMETVDSRELIPFLKNYFSREPVEKIIIGDPRNLDNTPTDATEGVNRLIRTLEKEFPRIPILRIDERFSSKLASRAIAEMGLRKKQRQSKALIDQVAATLMLQEFLNRTTT